jgi:YD repeat-containing protein
LGAEAASILRSQLFLSEELRREKVSQYGIPTELPVGTKMHSSECAKALITRTRDEYQHISCSKDIDYFDLAGRLVRKEVDGYKIVIHYVGERPDSVSDSLGQKLDLKWTTTGRVAEARAKQDVPVITYRYDEQENLVFSSEAEGNDSTYVYDAKHKLTAIRHTDLTHLELNYDEAGRITALNDSYNAPISYTYRNDPDYPSLHHWTTATTTRTEGRKTIRVAEYFSTLDTAGIKRLSRVIKTDGPETEEIVLDEKEHFKRISKSDGSYSEYSYHPILGKVTLVATNEGRTDFSYDKLGNLIRASTGKGHQIILSYDRQGSIVRMVESDKTKQVRRELFFKYNAQKKPIKISMVGKGEINVTYDKRGEISNVESKQGAKMALEVTQAFQSLLSLVKMAGASYCL